MKPVRVFTACLVALIGSANVATLAAGQTEPPAPMSVNLSNVKAAPVDLTKVKFVMRSLTGGCPASVAQSGAWATEWTYVAGLVEKGERDLKGELDLGQHDVVRTLLEAGAEFGRTSCKKTDFTKIHVSLTYSDPTRSLESRLYNLSPDVTVNNDGAILAFSDYHNKATIATEQQRAYTAFTKANGAKAIDINLLSVNPFAYAGQIVALPLVFVGMASATEGRFMFITSGGERTGSFLVSGLSATRFTEPNMRVMLAGRVLGKQGGSITLRFVGAVPCQGPACRFQSFPAV